ncbi:uncharacterized protein [Diadema antillarum]|uniref:uncharacterized protein n=1 Tax=Diadema antillarum TaxID=105358 RepID=UPI003A8B9A19
MASSNVLSTVLNGARARHNPISGRVHDGNSEASLQGSVPKDAGRPHNAAIIQTSLYVMVVMVILVCALIHLFIYRRRRKAKKKKHTYENTKPTKSGRIFHVEPKVFEKKSKTLPKVIEPEMPIYSQPGKALCYSIVDITDAVSSWDHIGDVGKSEPDLRRSCNYYESIQICPLEDEKKSYATSAKSKACEATTKLKKFGANKKTMLQRTFQSLTNLCVTNLDSCEDLTKRKDSTKCNYSRLMSPSSKIGRSVGNIYDTLSRQNPWKLAERGPGKYEEIEVHLGGDEKLWTAEERQRYQSISMPKVCPASGCYSEARFPLAGLAGYKTPQWSLNKFSRKLKQSEYEHVQLRRPVLKAAKSEQKPAVAPKNISPVYFTLDPAMKHSSNRTAIYHI